MADDSLLDNTKETKGMYNILSDQEIANLIDFDLGYVEKSTDKIHTFIDAQKKYNTVKATKRDLKVFTEYLYGNGEFRLIEDIPPKELDVILCNFYIDIRKKDGNEYEPGSLQSVKCSIDRYLRDHDKDYSVRDREFSLSNRTLDAKKIALRKAGKGQKPNASRAVTEKEENMMWEKGQLGDKTPRVLQFSLWYFFTKCFGLRGRHEHRQLCFGDIELHKDPVSDREYLEFRERLTKTRDGTGKENMRKVKPRLYATTTDRDPVELYKAFVARRPKQSNTPSSPFYLTCIPEARIDPDAEIWFYPKPMGENYLGKLMSMAAKECGIEHKTNHSVRKTCVKTLRKAGIARDKIKHITGHKSTHTLESYDDGLSDDEQIMMSDILTSKDAVKPFAAGAPTQGKEVVEKNPITDVSMDTDGPQCSPSTLNNLGKGTLSNLFGSGTVLNNCTFNINVNIAQGIQK